MYRGQYLEEYKEKYGINNVDELRLIPYLQYCLINQEPIDPNKTHPKERVILSDWQSKGYISGCASDVICISREFWDIIHDCLWYAYANQLENDNYSNRKNAEDELSIDVGLELMSD